MNDKSKLLLAFLAGAAAGAIAGVLFAPGKGSETRERIKEEGKEFADSFMDKIKKEFADSTSGKNGRS